MTHDPEKYAAAIRARLGQLADLGAKAKASEQAIQEASEKRLMAVDTDLAKLRPRVMLDDEAARKVEDLTLERGRLMRVVTLWWWAMLQYSVATNA